MIDKYVSYAFEKATLKSANENFAHDRSILEQVDGMYLHLKTHGLYENTKGRINLLPLNLLFYDAFNDFYQELMKIDPRTLDLVTRAKADMCAYRIELELDTMRSDLRLAAMHCIENAIDIVDSQIRQSKPRLSVCINEL